MAGFTFRPEPKGRNSMHIRLAANDILVLAEEYLNLPFGQRVSNRMADERIERKFHTVRHRGHMTADDLRATAYWKCRGNRLASRLDENAPEDVEEITRVSFATTNERLRIGAMRALHGVDWPVASVILHFAFPDRYPILDVHVMHAIDGPSERSFDSWTRVANFCRNQAAKYGVTMRELDRALWTHGYKANRQG